MPTLEDNDSSSAIGTSEDSTSEWSADMSSEEEDAPKSDASMKRTHRYNYDSKKSKRRGYKRPASRNRSLIRSGSHPDNNSLEKESHGKPTRKASKPLKSPHEPWSITENIMFGMALAMLPNQTSIAK